MACEFSRVGGSGGEPDCLSSGGNGFFVLPLKQQDEAQNSVGVGIPAVDFKSLVDIGLSLFDRSLTVIPPSEAHIETMQ